MRPAGRFVAETFSRTLRDETKVGTNLLAIDALAHQTDPDAPARSPATSTTTRRSAPARSARCICTSVNDAVLHGLPFDYALRDGDLLTLDFAVSVDGWVADSAVSFVVGTPAPTRGCRTSSSSTRRSGRWMPRSPRPGRGNRIGDISARDRRGRAQATATDQHRLRRPRRRAHMHGDPHVPNDGRKPAAATRCARASSSRSSRGSSRRPTRSHRPRRLDPAQRRRLPRRALRAHDRDHGGRAADPHRARLSV